MSWKSFACVAALSALIAMPAVAQTVSVVNEGLDANGDWVWAVNVDSGAASSAAAELDITLTDAGVVNAALVDAIFDTDNPSPSTLSWVAALLDGSGILTGGIAFDAAADEAVIARGSDVLADATQYTLARITTEGPSTAGSLTSSIAVAGNLAQDGSNNAVSISDSITALAGDINLDGNVDPTDLNELLFNFGNSGANWATGDLNGDGTVNPTDLNELLFNFGASSSAAVANAVPEPASAAMLVGMLALGAFRKRN